MALRGRRITNFIKLWSLVASGGLEIWVSVISFWKSNICWPRQPIISAIGIVHNKGLRNVPKFFKMFLLSAQCPQFLPIVVCGQNSDFPICFPSWLVWGRKSSVQWILLYPNGLGTRSTSSAKQKTGSKSLLY